MLKVLILSRDLRMPGGVVNLVNAISKKFSNEVKVDHLFIGKNVESKGLLDFFKPLIDSIKLLKKIQNTRYDVIHINPSLDIKSGLRDGLFMLVINMRKTHKTLVFFHGWEEKIAKTIINNKFFCFLMRVTYGKGNKIIVLAEKFSKQLVDMGVDKNKIIVFYTMFDGDIFNNIKKQSDKNKITLLFMSRFVAAKGMVELLDAFNTIKNRHPEVTLHLIGDGPEKVTVEKKISELGLQKTVKLLGYLEGKEKAQALVNADIFVFPTYYGEGCPISLLEAMAAGLPVITTTVGGIPDIVTDEKNGVLLTSHTPNMIEEGIEKILANEIRRKEIGELNRKTAWENYESKVVTAEIEAIYRQIVNMEST